LSGLARTKGRKFVAEGLKAAVHDTKGEKQNKTKKGSQSSKQT
jgi:hypothetical protein